MLGDWRNSGVREIGHGCVLPYAKEAHSSARAGQKIDDFEIDGGEEGIRTLDTSKPSMPV